MIRGILTPGAGVGLGLLAAALLLAGCVTLPGQAAAPEFTPRVVDREYPVVWETLLAALRNEGAQVNQRDPQRGVIETAFRPRLGTKVVARGIMGDHETLHPLVHVRYSVRAQPLGPDKTEVRLRTMIQYMDLGTRQWVPTADDGSVADAFWRRFDQDLAYYGARPETWRPDGSPPVPGLPSGEPTEGGAGGSPPGLHAR